ncbi:MAG: metallophosphoesterase [Anaerolineae bacterium]|nr:metallophosphoesterase [Anaerolineae bacterium]
MLRQFLKYAMPAVWAIEPAFTRLNRRLLPPRMGPDWVEVKQISLALPRLAAEFHGYRLVQISDLHSDISMTPARLAQVVELINWQQPDLVAITGDFVSYEAHPHLEEVATAFSRLTPRDGTVAILGNHDYWTDVTFIRQALRRGGMIDLNNAVYTLRRGETLLHIAGVDDFWEDRASKMAQLPTEGAAILLAHESDFADLSAATCRFDLQLSGHSHGGQVIIPFWGPLAAPPYGLKYPLGCYRLGEMWLYTNRGLGESSVRIRINCRPEITVFTLESGQFTNGHG